MKICNLGMGKNIDWERYADERSFSFTWRGQEKSGIIHQRRQNQTCGSNYHPELRYTARHWNRKIQFYIHGSVHRNSRLKKPNKMQQYAVNYLLLNYCTCFGRPSRPSSGVHKTVVAASGTDHTVWGASFFKRDQMRSRLKKNFEKVDSFMYLGSLVTGDNNVSKEISNRFTAANRSYFGLKIQLKSQLLSRKTEILICI